MIPTTFVSVILFLSENLALKTFSLHRLGGNFEFVNYYP